MGNKMTKPICTVMVGLPALGKSTITKKLFKTYGKNDVPFVYSTDGYIESVATAQGKTYNEVFANTIEEATEHMNDFLQYAIDDGRDVIWDQTNLSVKKREKIINRMKQAGYDIDCICIMPPDVLAKHSTAPEDYKAACDEWAERLMHRPGKTIPTNVIVNMITSFVPPIIEEGFNKITFYDMDGAIIAIDYK